MWRRGVNREQIRRVLGHHSWDFTASTYVHLGEDDIPDGSVLGDLVGNERASELTKLSRDDAAAVRAESA